MKTMFNPTIRINNVLKIDKVLLYKLRVKGLILDLDNTLSKDGSPIAELGIADWLTEMRELGIKLIIVSNNTRRRVAPLARELGLRFVAFGCKPLPIGISRAVKSLADMGLRRDQIAIVGDQIFTDVLGGNVYGIKSVLVEPFYLEQGNILFKAKRKIEEVMFNRDFS